VLQRASHFPYNLVHESVLDVLYRVDTVPHTVLEEAVPLHLECMKDDVEEILHGRSHIRLQLKPARLLLLWLFQSPFVEKYS
jgi:hypothetical protein